MKNRDIYLNQLIQYKDKPIIKVVTGIRRCGKSTLLSLFESYLLSKNIPKDHIIRLNFESYELLSISDYKELHTLIQGKMINNKEKHYILLDEIQLIPSWEKVINSYLVDANVDIYITGSNAYLLSSELSTLLSGRYVEIKMLPLSFKEFTDFTQKNPTESKNKTFNTYIKYGGLPNIPDLLEYSDTIGPFLEGIYNTVLVKDVIERNKVRDTALLESLLKFLAANVGSIVSTKKISDYLTSNRKKTTSDTIENYLKMLQDAFIIYKATRYDLKGKKYLKTLEKYYMVDIGILNQLIGFKHVDYGHVLENLVFLELIRRGYTVSIGKINNLEIDFIATKPTEKIYIQVSASIQSEKTRQREFLPLEKLTDNYPKYIITMDTTVYNDYNGIQIINMVDFLLNTVKVKR